MLSSANPRIYYLNPIRSSGLAEFDEHHANFQQFLFQIMLLVMSGVLFWRTYATFSTDPEYYYVHQILGVSDFKDEFGACTQ